MSSARHRSRPLPREEWPEEFEPDGPIQCQECGGWMNTQPRSGLNWCFRCMGPEPDHRPFLTRRWFET